MNNRTLAEIEEALDAGRLQVQVTGNRWWKCRRNGATKHWKRTGDWRIPIKAGFRTCGAITPESLEHFREAPQ